MAPKPRIESKKHVARLERERRQTRAIQFVAIVVVAAVLLILAYGYLEINFLQDRQPVATVNGEKITTSEFRARVTIQRTRMVNQYMEYLQLQQAFGMDFSTQLQEVQFALDTPTVVGRQVLDALIQEALIRQEAERRGIEVPAPEFERYLQGQFRYYPDGSPTPTVTPTAADFSYPTLTSAQLRLITPTSPPTAAPSSTPSPAPTQPEQVTPEATATPRPTATPYTLEAFQEEYANQLTSLEELGLTEDQYTRALETEYLRAQLFEQITADTPREEEQVWTRQILLADEDTANQVVERLRAGADFGELARELSEDTGSRETGGDLGWRSPTSLVPEYEAALSTLEAGEISAPVQSSLGWHVIQMLGRVTVPLDPDQYTRARQVAFEQFLAELRDQAEVELFEYWTQRVPTSPGLESLGL